MLYVQPLGHFTPAQTRVVALTAEFMSRFFSLAVRVRDPAQLDKVPRYASLAEFCAEHGLEEERRFFDDSLRALEKN